MHTDKTKVSDEDLDQFSDLPTDDPFSEWSDGALAYLFLSAWNSINVTECFGTSDLQHERAAAKRLHERGYDVDMKLGHVYRPDGRDLTDITTPVSDEAQ